jgi:mercuric ion transport protein
MSREPSHFGTWSALGAVLSALAASVCCVGPLVLLTLGIGGAWASRIAVLEPYRPVLIVVALGLLGLAFYRAYGKDSASCAADSACVVPKARDVTRAVLWSVAALVVGLLTLPYYGPHVFGAAKGTGGVGSACCSPAAIASLDAVVQPTTRSTMANEAVNIDPAREIVFKVANLGCPLVNGVGCGHMLAPALSQLDSLEGVSRSYSNWTGTALRISVAPKTDPAAVAERVRSFLAADQQNPARVNGDELIQILNDEQWRAVDRIAELSAYEFHTFAKRQVGAFADDEKLDDPKRQKLLALVDEVWNKSGEGMGEPKPEAEAYGHYWQARCDKLVQLYAERARDLLTPEQVEKLVTQYGARKP